MSISTSSSSVENPPYITSVPKSLKCYRYHNQRHFFSSTRTNNSARSDDEEYDDNDGKDIKKNNAPSLRQMVRPFLLTYHPDRQQAHNSTAVAREVNLKAIQTLNGLVDTIESLYERASSGHIARTTATGRLELDAKYTIEFSVPTESEEGTLRKTKNEPVSTRRSVEIAFTEFELKSVQSIDAKSGRYSLAAAEHVRVKVMKETMKLLRVAGLPLSRDLVAEVEELADSNDDEYTSFQESLFHDELGLDEEQKNNQRFGRTFTYSRKPKTHRERSKERFMKSVDWKKLRRSYDEAVEDLKRDLATDGLIKLNEERRQRVIADVISRIRIDDKAPDGSSLNDGNESAYRDDDESGLGTLEQLIAIRRMSLLFSDNFEELEFEDYGELWDRTVIVLTPERNNEGKTGEPFSKKKRLLSGRESGFKFAYHSDDRLTIYVPVDFTDDEIVSELSRHLRDFCGLCLSADGFEDLIPPAFR